MEKNKQNTATPINSSALNNLKIPRTFEIMVEEMHEEDNGTIRWRPVMIDSRLGGDGHVTITVNSQNELKETQQWYKQAGQRFKIIREINPPSQADIERMASEQGVQLNSNITANKHTTNNMQLESIKNNQNIISQTVKPIEKQQISKIITIGDVQIKYDGDSVYQKQWVRLSPKEESNIRVVSDTNNKLVPMKNRHFEVKRWVKIEGGSVLDETSDI